MVFYLLKQDAAQLRELGAGIAFGLWYAGVAMAHLAAYRWYAGEDSDFRWFRRQMFPT